MAAPIAVQMWPLRQRASEDFFGVLKDIAGMGYKGVEFGGVYGKEPAEVKKVLDDLGLAVCGLHMPVPTPENVGKTLEWSALFDCKMVISLYGPDHFTTVENVKVEAAKLEAGAQLLKPHGISLGYHSHWWEFVLVGGRWGHLLIFENAPSLFCEIDTYWTSNFNVIDVPAIIRMQRKMVPLLHVKDGPLVRDQPQTAVGAGKLNIPECIKACDPKTLKWIIVELDDCATDMTEAIRQSYQYLTKNKLAKGTK